MLMLARGQDLRDTRGGMPQSYIIRPTFLESGFSFDGPVPAHLDRKPTDSLAPNSYGLYAVYLNVLPDEIIALDVPDLSMIGFLLRARLEYKKPAVMAYGVMEDIYLLELGYPIKHRLYQGWGGVEAQLATQTSSHATTFWLSM